MSWRKCEQPGATLIDDIDMQLISQHCREDECCIDIIDDCMRCVFCIGGAWMEVVFHYKMML